MVPLATAAVAQRLLQYAPIEPLFYLLFNTTYRGCFAFTPRRRYHSDGWRLRQLNFNFGDIFNLLGSYRKEVLQTQMRFKSLLLKFFIDLVLVPLPSTRRLQLLFDLFCACLLPSSCVAKLLV